MKNFSKILLLVSFAFTFISAARISDHQYMAAAPLSVNTGTPDSISVNTLVNISRKDFEKKIGRKLGLFERMALRKVKKKLKKEPGWVFDDTKVPTESVISAVSGGLGFLASPMAFATAVGNIDCDGNCSNASSGFLLLALLGFFFAVTLGMLGLKKIKDNPGQYKGGFLAKIGILITAFVLLLLLLLVVSL
ncbi:MAG TPA: hypothetical protein ENJ95_13985 [Bacteroidetes bacterium]|nr:hypothetical protein [Bacteroidota bacterium]